MAENDRTQAQFEFIELVSAYEGLVTNQRLREQFSISNVQASRILAAYRSANPRNLAIVSGEGRGRYVPTSRFVPAVASLSVDRYFAVAAGSDISVPREDVRRDFTQVDPKTFREIHSALKTGRALQAVYRSMTHPDGRERVLHPRAFVFAGRRWHLRAFDEDTGEHRDFNLARFQQVELTQKGVATPEDLDWNQQVQLLLRPHPLLTPAQNRLIRDELFKGATGRRVTTRRALIPYVLKELEVAEDADAQRPPDYQLYLYRIE